MDYKAKGRVYMALVLGIFLCGSEVWSLREDLTDTAPAMRRITIAHAICHRITAKSPLAKLEMEPFDNYYNHRLLW